MFQVSDAPLDLETELAWGFLDYLLLGTSAPGIRVRLGYWLGWV